MFDKVLKNGQSAQERTKGSRTDQVRLFKGCLLQILLGPFLNTLIHIITREKMKLQKQTISL